MKMRRRIRGAARAATEVLYGMSTFGWVRQAGRERATLEQLFFLIIFGDLIGLPLLPSYYSLRLLPYIMPYLSRIRRSLLRERDLSDLAGLAEGTD